MPISFSCPRCGRKLKAPDNAAGKSATCQGCGSKVTCPSPGHDADAEAIPRAPATAPAGGADPYGDLDEGSPYRLTGSEPPAAAAAGSRRLCPTCGATILATAPRCRSCGAVFDPSLRRPKKKKRRKTSVDWETFRSAPPWEWKIPLGLLIIGLATIVIHGLATGGAKGGVVLLLLIGLRLAVYLPVSIVTMFVAAAVLGITFGEFKSAIVKLAGIQLFTSALVDVGTTLGHPIMGALLSAATGFVLFAKAFELTFWEAFKAMFVMGIVQWLLSAALASFVVSRRSSPARGHEGTGRSRKTALVVQPAERFRQVSVLIESPLSRGEVARRELPLHGPRVPDLRRLVLTPGDDPRTVRAE